MWEGPKNIEYDIAGFTGLNNESVDWGMTMGITFIIGKTKSEVYYEVRIYNIFGLITISKVCSAGNEVAVYTSEDKIFAAPILQAFEKRRE